MAIVMIFDTYTKCKMITVLINASIPSQNYHLVCVVITVKIYTLNHFQVYNSVVKYSHQAVY